jgi:hypothetical protein
METEVTRSTPQIQVTDNSNIDSRVEMEPLASCDHCEFDCEIEEDLRKHIKDMHSILDCLNCKFTTGEDIVLKNHEENCPTMSASQEQTIADKSVGVEEIKEKVKEEEEADVIGENNDSRDVHVEQQSGVLFLCEKCNFTTKTDIGLKHHQDYYCDICSICSPDKNWFTIHSSFHKECQANACEYKAVNTNDISSHVKESHPKIYPCEKCGNTFVKIQDLYDHDRLHKETEKSSENVMFYCGFCSDKFQTKDKCYKHMLEHTTQDEVPKKQLNMDNCFICGQCGKGFPTKTECIKHIQAHPFVCFRCPFQSNDPHDVASHENKYHSFMKGSKLPGSAEFVISDCKDCGSKFKDNIAMKDHKCNLISCEQCDFSTYEVSSHVKHLLEKHTRKKSCPFCDYEDVEHESLATHIWANHEQLSLLSTIGMQVSQFSENFANLEVFKEELTGILNKIIDAHNSVKQELFLIRNHLDVKNILQSSGTTVTPSPPATSSPEAPCPTSSPATKKPPTTSQNRKKHNKTANKETQVKPSVTRPNQGQNLPSSTPIKPAQPIHHPPAQPELMFIGDSISNSLDTKILAKASDSRITKVKAYSSVREDISNIAKQAAKYPHLNFTDVAGAELSKQQYDIMVLQAGSVDITNLNARDNVTEHFEYFNGETVRSARNLFSVAENSLKTHPSLQQVVIMKHIPRYDTMQADPLQIKAALSQIFNTVLADLWIKSPHKNKIFVGSHNIECIGAIREARYKCTKSRKFDGVHLYGSTGMKAYTNSVMQILKCAGLISADCPPCPQFQYQDRKQRISCPRQCYSQTQDKDIRRENAYTVPTQNRFSKVFARHSGNL